MHALRGLATQTFRDERNTLKAGSTVLQDNALSVRPMRRVSYKIPRAETEGGKLKVQCTSPSAGGGIDGFETGGCSIIAVWLEPLSSASQGNLDRGAE
eukprot:SAG22_NODE_1558_length_4129_cov_2.138213_3_plen_98_part_00